jgi:nitrate reductase gamma subunit
MTTTLYLTAYFCAGVFLFACLARIIMYAKTPIHLRWELYPVPHEKPARVRHGGSYFEESGWWEKPAHFHFLGQLKFMIPEILFLKGLFEFNRRLWYCSFPFHFGLYLLFGTLGLLVSGALLGIVPPFPGAEALMGAIRFIYPLTGAAGLALAMLGAIGLLVRRMTDEGLRIYTTWGDLGNLLFFVISTGVWILACVTRSAGGPDMMAITRGALTWNTTLAIQGETWAAIFLAALLLAYIPLTHMSHFIAKYFTYHSVRWDDVRNSRGGKLEARLAEYLTYRPTWSATHVGADGRKSWTQIALSKPATEAKK